MARNYNLAPFQELRIVTHDSYANLPIQPSVKLLNGPAPADLIPNQRGAAEIFGRDLVADVDYAIDEGEKIAIFTWVGCSIQVKGMVMQEYEGSDQAMKEYLNVMHALNVERELAVINRIHGPRVLVTGSPSSGKSSVCQIMCNYAVRSGWSPLFVEADPRCSTDKRPLQMYPGTIGATLISSAADEPPDNPLVYHFGYSDVQEHEKLYLQVSQAMAANIEIMMDEALENQPHARRSGDPSEMGKYIAPSGMIINAPYSANRGLIVDLARIYNISMVLVIDNPSVHQELIRTFQEMSTSKVAKVQGGVVEAQVLGNLAFQENPVSQMLVDEEKKDEQDMAASEPIAEKETKDVLVLAVNKLEGVVAVDKERLKYLHTRAWRRYFDMPPGDMHMIKIQIENLQLLCIETSTGLCRDALPTDEEGRLNKEEMYAAEWAGDPVSLTNSILSIPSTEDIKLIPYCNVLGFFFVRSVEISDVLQNSAADQEYAAQEAVEEDLYKAETTYIFDVLCASIYTPTVLPRYLIVPGNLRSMKLQTF